VYIPAATRHPAMTDIAEIASQGAIAARTIADFAQ
jgi:hypothetical protein